MSVTEWVSVCDALGHRLDFGGRASVPLPNCECPIRLVCRTCGYVVVKRCESAKARVCGPCSESHRRRVARIVRSGFEVVSEALGLEVVPSQSGKVTGVFMLTLTAPGADLLPWDEERCTHAPDVACSGAVGCRTERVPTAIWNGRTPRAWSDFTTYLRRVLPDVDVQFVKVYEPQKRGALHIHAVVRAVGVSERRLKAACRLVAMRWGFGRQVDVRSVSIGGEWYLAKYATKGAEMTGVPYMAADGELISPRVRMWSSSRRWGLTMGQLRASQRAWACGQGAEPAGGHGVPEPVGTGGGAALDLNGADSTLKNGLRLLLDAFPGSLVSA